MIIVLGSVKVASGHVDEALAISREHVARSRAEPGCVAHTVYVDDEDPNRLVFVERWADMAALSTHFMVPASRAFGKQLAAIAAEPPEMTLYDANAMPSPLDRRPPA
jgi:quinol monooxygenase YgiN